MQVRLSIQGRVQGVGFRPSIYRYAVSLGLSGHVRNTGNGNVEVLIEGKKDAVDEFTGGLTDALPPLAEILSIETERVSLGRQKGFRILPSVNLDGAASDSFIPERPT